MNKFYLLGLGLISSIAPSFGQTVKTTVKEAPNFGTEVIKQGSYDLGSIRASQTCNDTVDYSLYRSIDQTGGVSYATVTMEDSANSIAGMGIFFPVPSGQSVSVTGVEFLAFGIKADGSASQVTVSVFAAAADSTATGTALGTVTVSVDTNATTFADITQFAPVVASNITGNFVVTVEAGSPTDSLVQLTGGVGSIGGQLDGFPTNVEVGTTWNRFGAANIFGNIVPRIHPLVTYTAENSLSSSVSQLSGPNETVNFTTTSPTIGETYLALNGLFQNPNTSSIDFGDGNVDNDASNSPSNTYVDETQDYTVVLTDSIFQYNLSTPVCVITETVTIAMATPNSINDVDAERLTAYIAQGSLRIMNADQNIKIYSITGALVSEINTNNTTVEISTGEFSQGVYLIQSGDQVLKIKL